MTKFNNYRMVDLKMIGSQFQEFLHLRSRLENEGMSLPDRYVVTLLLKRLHYPDSHLSMSIARVQKK